MRNRLKVFIGALLTVAAMSTAFGAPAPAAPAERAGVAERPGAVIPAGVELAATLWHCRVPDYYPPYYRYEVCTRIANAPASGVQVRDRSSGRVVTLYNGNGVWLNWWYVDQSGRCGVNGDPYVWWIGWHNSTGDHGAMIGDWYVATGGTSTWKPFPTAPGASSTLGDQYAGTGSGTCDVFPA